MIKNRFYKNLYQTLSCFSIILILELLILSGYIISLGYDTNNRWILPVISISLIVLFFSCGFFWIFQKVVVSEEGIQITFMKKIIKECRWKGIESYEIKNIMRNPAINIKLSDGSEIHLDKRKDIIYAITYYAKTDKLIK